MRFGSAQASDSDFYNKEVALNELLQRFFIDSASASITSVGDEVASTQLLAANSSRKGAIIHNDSSSILRIAFGATASASSFTIRLNPYATYEMSAPVFRGVLNGIWDSDAGGNARITEFT